jgi:DNA-binding HxlR family transcriptional regulator
MGGEAPNRCARRLPVAYFLQVRVEVKGFLAMPPRSSQICPRYQAAMEMLGKRWTGLVLNVLMDGPRRFSEIAAQLEVVSDRVLSERLQELEAQDIVRRGTVRGQPGRFHYRLTPKGKALRSVVGEIERWASAWVTL